MQKRRAMANGKAGIFRRLWDLFKAMDNSSFDYSMDRIIWLERDVAQLKDELKQVRALSGITSAEIRTTKPITSTLPGRSCGF